MAETAKNNDAKKNDEKTPDEEKYGQPQSDASTRITVPEDEKEDSTDTPLNGTPPFPVAADETAPPAGVGSDLRVDSPIDPENGDGPRPTAALGK
jgi:hypothetical protein